MVRTKNEKEDLLFPIFKKRGTLIQGTHTKPRETLEFKLNKSREPFIFNPPIQIKGDWMIGLTDLEDCNSIFNTNTTKNKFKLYKFPDEKAGGIS